jgi:hypothetical protein
VTALATSRAHNVVSRRAFSVPGGAIAKPRGLAPRAIPPSESPLHLTQAQRYIRSHPLPASSRSFPPSLAARGFTSLTTDLSNILLLWASIANLQYYHTKAGLVAFFPVLHW